MSLLERVARRLIANTRGKAEAQIVLARHEDEAGNGGEDTMRAVSHSKLAKDISTTTEFFIPVLGLDVSAYISAGQMDGIHHMSRYQWAMLALAEKRPKSIIDIACGAGYGSYMLANAFPDAKVVGADYDERAVEYARNTYQSENLSYAIGDITSWTFDKRSIQKTDIIVSFDTIEHLLHREIALMNLADHLTDDGWLLLSTPCGHDETKMFPAWEHHKIEYSHSDLFALLSRFFRRIVQPQDKDYPAADFWHNIINGQAPLYLNRMNPIICEGPTRAPAYSKRI